MTGPGRFVSLSALRLWAFTEHASPERAIRGGFVNLGDEMSYERRRNGEAVCDGALIQSVKVGISPKGIWVHCHIITKA